MCDNQAIQDAEIVENQETVIDTFEITKRDKIYVILFIIASVGLSIFGICKGFNLGFTATLCLLLICAMMYFCKGAKKATFFAAASIILSFAMTLSFSLTTNFAIRFFSIVLILTKQMKKYF